MRRFTQAPKTAAGIGAFGVVLALTGGLVLATPALAADDSEIFGSTSIVLDFTIKGQLGVEITTQNLSATPAWGTGSITIPDGQSFDFGPSEYAAGETRTFAGTLPGHPCSDLPLMSAVAFGYADRSDTTPEWTSGEIRYPDSRITVIGCAPTPTPTGSPTITPTPTGSPTITPTPTGSPTITPTPTGSPTITPTPTGSPTITPTPTGSPTITPTPTGSPTITPTPTGSPTITPTGSPTTTPAGGSSGGSLAQTGTAIGATLLVAAAGVMAVAAGVFMRGRRRDESQ